MMAKEVKYFESDIKALLIQFLMEKNILSEDAIIINELTVDKYARRADIVLLKKDELHAYEIKSDADSLTRLGKVRTSIPRTKNENFSHLISMGYQ